MFRLAQLLNFPVGPAHTSVLDTRLASGLARNWGNMGWWLRVKLAGRGLGIQ